MRFVLYNIRYGTGGGKIRFPLSGYLGHTHKTLENIGNFLHELGPDVAGLVEVDAGSYRTRRKNQAEILAEKLGHHHVYRSKYGEKSWARRVPVFSHQGNAFVVRDSKHQEVFHYFEKGMKQMVIELDLGNVAFFLLHLPLIGRVRHRQLAELYAMLQMMKKPYILAGDFNVLWGEYEIQLFLAAAGLKNAHERVAATFPSWNPKRHLDLICYSAGIEISNCWMPQVLYSDHLPIVCDFHVV